MVRPQDGHRSAEADRRVEPNFSPDPDKIKVHAVIHIHRGRKYSMSGKKQSSFSVPRHRRGKLCAKQAVPRCPAGPARFNQQIARISGLLGQLRTRPWHDGFVIGASGASARQGSCRFSRQPCTLAAYRAFDPCQTGRTDVGHGMKQFRYCVPIHRRCDKPTRCASPRQALLFATSATEPDWGRVVQYQAQTFVV